MRRFEFSQKSFAMHSVLIATCCVLAGCSAPIENRATPIVDHENLEASVELEAAPNAGANNAVIVRMYDNGTLKALEREGRIVHIVLASADHEDITHVLAPASIADGVYRFPHTFTRAGAYRIWIEVDDAKKAHHHDENADLIAYRDVTIEGASATASTLIRGTSTVVDGFTVTVVPSELRAGEPLNLGLKVSDASGKSVQLASPEGALFALVGQNFDFFRHGHMNTERDGLTTVIPNTFPAAGGYVLWVYVFFTADGQFYDAEIPYLLTVL